MRLTQSIFRILHKPLTTVPCCFSYMSCPQNHSAKRTHPSADRNSHPISQAMKEQLSLEPLCKNANLLEIAFGSGQHAGFLAPLFPHITFQPTEYDRDQFDSIAAYASSCATGNILQPVWVDISADSIKVPLDAYEYMFNSNMMHISPWVCSVGLFRTAGKILKPGGKLFTYGPYAQHGQLTPESNVSFDQSLRARNSEWGVRDIDDLEILAKNNGVKLDNIKEMPSNNKFLTWSKES